MDDAQSVTPSIPSALPLGSSRTCSRRSPDDSRGVSHHGVRRRGRVVALLGLSGSGNAGRSRGVSVSFANVMRCECRPPRAAYSPEQIVRRAVPSRESDYRLLSNIASLLHWCQRRQPHDQ